jgi:ubiquinone/menaquinone biosynthesis C-methylase UbiE
MSEPRILTKQMAEQFFDRTAKSYDRVGPSFFSQFGERLVEQMPLAHGARVLDIATGKGAVLLPAARRVGSKGHVIGIDLSGKLLKEAERITRAEGLTNIELRKMDAEHLEFPDNTFDFVTCAFALFVFPDMEAALREMFRVCKPGGYVAITNFNKGTPFFHPAFTMLLEQFIAYQARIVTPPQASFTAEEIDELLGRFGFSSIKTQSELNDIVYASAEDCWGFLLTLPPAATMLSMSEEKRARFKDELLAKLRAASHEDGLHLSSGIIYTLAKR